MDDANNFSCCCLMTLQRLLLLLLLLLQSSGGMSEIPPVLRSFVVLPYMHSEALQDQQVGALLAACLIHASCSSRNCTAGTLSTSALLLFSSTTTGRCICAALLVGCCSGWQLHALHGFTCRL
jgi:hypothetical protein